MNQHETPDPADEPSPDQSPRTSPDASDEARADTAPVDVDPGHATTQSVDVDDTTGDVAPGPSDARSADDAAAPEGVIDPDPNDAGLSDPIPDPPPRAADAGPPGEPAGGAPPPPPPAGPPLRNTPPPQGPPPGSSGWSRPPLRSLSRRSHDRVLQGVAGGLGDYFNVDPAIFRLVFVGLSFFGGTGVMLYALGWLLIPDRTTGHSVGEDLVRRLGGSRSVATWIIAGLAILILINASDIFDADLLWAAALVGVGIVFFRRQAAPTTTETDRGDDLPPAPVATPQPAPYSAPPREPSHLGTEPAFETRTSTLDDGWRPTPYVPPPSPPPPPSVLGRVTVAATLIICGILALLQTLTALSISVDTYAAVAAIVVGAGLVVGARLGRSRGLIALGLLLVATMALSASLQFTLANGVGERNWQPDTVADLQDRYELGMGELTIDLTELELEPGSDVTVEGAVGIGQLSVDVPPDTTVDVTATSNGAISAFDQSSDGTRAELAHVRDGPEGSPTITLILSTGLGVVDVQEAPAPGQPPLAPPGVN